MGGHIGQGALATLAAGSWDASSTTAGEAIIAIGCSVAAAGEGIVEVTLDQPCNELNMIAPGPGFRGNYLVTAYSLEHVSDTVKRFHFQDDEGADAARDFDFIFFKGAS